MCSPTLALQAYGAGQSAVGAFFGAASQKSALKSQARMAQIQATVDENSARNVLADSNFKQTQIMERGAQTKAAQKAGFAANGIDVGVGSAINVYTSTDYVTEIDKNNAAAQGIADAWGYRMKATSDRNTALAARTKANAIDPLQAATTSLLGSAGSVAKSWYAADSAGALGGGSSNSPSNGGFGMASADGMDTKDSNMANGSWWG